MWTMIGIASLFSFGCAFFYVSGKISGLTDGAIYATTYYRQKGALKDKSNIIGFNSWPEAMRQLFEAETKLKIEDE